MFMASPAGFHGLGTLCRKTCDVDQPARQDGVGRKRPGFAGEQEKCGLSDILREIPVPKLATGGRIDEVRIAVEQESEGLWIAADIGREKRCIGRVGHSVGISTPGVESD